MSDELPEEKTDGTESKIDATNRLQEFGLWVEASAYRTERRIQYRNAGSTKKEAGEKAWDDMRLKYPRPGVEPIEPADIVMPESDPEPEENLVHIAATDMDVARDIAWAYDHLRDRRVRADQAPSGGAWSMLEYAQQVPHKFVELVARYDAQQKKHEVKTNEDFIADADEQIKEIDKLLAITEAVHYDAVLDAIRQSPGEVIKALRKAGWTVSRPAGEPLEPAGRSLR